MRRFKVPVISVSRRETILRGRTSGKNNQSIYIQYDYTHSLIYSRKDETKETIIDPAPARRGGSDAVECTDGCHRR